MCSVIDHGNVAFFPLFIGATSYFSKGKTQRHCLKDLLKNLESWASWGVQKHWCFLTCSSWCCFLGLLRAKFQWQGSACSHSAWTPLGKCMFAFSMDTSWEVHVLIQHGHFLAPLANVWDFHLGKWRMRLNSKQLSLLSETRFWILTDTEHSRERKHKAWFMCAGCPLPEPPWESCVIRNLSWAHQFSRNCWVTCQTRKAKEWALIWNLQCHFFYFLLRH